MITKAVVEVVEERPGRPAKHVPRGCSQVSRCHQPTSPECRKPRRDTRETRRLIFCRRTDARQPHPHGYARPLWVAEPTSRTSPVLAV